MTSREIIIIIIERVQFWIPEFLRKLIKKLTYKINYVTLLICDEINK